MAIAISSSAERGLDLAASAVPAAAGAYAGATLGPLAGFAAFPAAGVLAGSIFAASFLVMGAIGRAQPPFVIPEFAPRDSNVSDLSELLLENPIEEDILLLEDEARWPPLLLDQPFVDGQVDELAELLLDDSIPPPPPHSRVVQLFATQPIPTAGQLAQRVDRHLGHASGASAVDATDALHEALEELRQSLRMA